MDPEVKAQCYRLPEYNRATIFVDPEKAACTDEVYDSVRHELLHVLLDSFAKVREELDCIIEKGSPLAAVIETSFTHAEEEAVAGIELMLDSCLTISARKLVAIGKRLEGNS